MFRPVLAQLVAGCVALTSPVSLLCLDREAPAGHRSSQAEERVLYVTVVDPATQEPLRELGPDDVVVREDAVRREVLRVTPASSPMPVALIVDNSQAMAPSIADLRRALATFVTAIDGLGPVTLVTVADRPTIAQGYTSSLKEAQDAANRLFHTPSSGATLLDGISEVAKGLTRRESDRAAIVVVTGEHTDYSHLQYQDVLKDLRESGAALHAIVLVNPAGSFATDEARNRATVLDRGPRESGGVRMDVLTSQAFATRMKDLAGVLRAQHRVVYARPASLIPPDRIEVSSARPRLEARGTPARERKTPQ